MTLEKLKRIAASASACAILLLFILIAVMIYQMIIINGKKATINQLNQEIEMLEQEKEELEEDISIWISEWKIEERARQLDYIYPGDK